MFISFRQQVTFTDVIINSFNPLLVLNFDSSVARCEKDLWRMRHEQFDGVRTAYGATFHKYPHGTVYGTFFFPISTYWEPRCEKDLWRMRHKQFHGVRTTYGATFHKYSNGTVYGTFSFPISTYSERFMAKPVHKYFWNYYSENVFYKYLSRSLLENIIP